MNYRLKTITFILLHLFSKIYGQERMTPELAMQNNLKIVEAYVMKEVGCKFRMELKYFLQTSLQVQYEATTPKVILYSFSGISVIL